MIVFLNGKFVKKEKAKISVFDHGFLYGDGVYETLRTSNGKIWQLNDHLKRLKNSAKLLQLSLPYPLKKIGHLIEKTLKRNGFEESRIRVTLTRGMNHFDFKSCRKPTFCIQVQPLRPQPENIYKKGVKIVMMPIERALPEAKSVSLLPFIIGQQKAASQKAYETIFINTRGYVLEGTMTNIFMVKNGVLITPRSNILEGTTRKSILQLAKKMSIPTKINDFKGAHLYQADEVFLTNAPRGIIPAIRVDGRKIGKGIPGAITQKLSQKYHELIAKHEKIPKRPR